MWTLSWFDPVEEHLVGSEDFLLLSDPEVAQILAVSVNEALGGEFPMDQARADRFRTATGYIVHIDLFDYFLGASASSQTGKQTPG